MAQPPYASRFLGNSAKMSESYTERTEFGDVQFHHDEASPFETIQGRIGDIEIGTRVCLHASSFCLGTVKWIGRYREARPGGYLVGVKLDDIESAPSADRTYGEYRDTQLVHTTRKDVIFRGIRSWCVVKEERQSEHANAEAEKLFYQRQAPDSKFNRIVTAVNGFQDGSRVKLKSDTTGTIKWIGCYRKKEMQLKDYIVGVELDSTSKEDMSLLTNGLLEGEQLVRSHKSNIKFVKLKELTSLSVPQKSSQQELQQKMDAPSREERHSGHARTERETQDFYKQQSPDSRFDRIEMAVNGFQDGSRVILKSGTTGTVKWIGCYRKKKVQPNDYIVAVELDSTSKENTSLLTNGRYEGEQLVRSHKFNIKFVKLKELTSLSVPQKSSQQELQQKMDAKSRDPLSHGKPGYAVPVTPAASNNPMHGRQLPPTPGQEKNKQEFPVINNQPPLKTQNAVATNGHSFDHGHQRVDVVASKEPVKRLDTSESCPRPSPPPRARRQASHEHEPMDTTDSLNLLPKPQQPSAEMTPFQVVGGPKANKDPIVCIDNVPESCSLYGMNQKLQKEVINRVGINEITHSSSANRAPEEPSHRVSYDQGARDKVYPGRAQVKPVDVNKVPIVRQPSYDSHHHGEVYYSAEMEREWERDQLDAGIVLRGRVEKQKDNTYLTNIVPLDKSERELIDSVGDPLADVVEGYALPPTHKEQYRGIWKGVQGDQNSCYMDASIFAMFSFLSVFDNILFDDEMLNKHSKFEDREKAKKIRSTLLRQVVNPLRKYGLVQKQGMHELRRQLDEWGLVRGLTGDEKDPEEFLNLLLVHTFSTPPPICLSNGQELHLFQVLAEKEEGMTFPTVQELVERTCLQEAYKFQKIPPYLILHLPRCGKDFKMYDYVMPNLELNITDVLCGTRQTCYVCGNAAYYECYGCYKDTHVISDACFCHTCAQEYHSNAQRSSHKPQKLASVRDDGVESPKCVLKLAAVLCIETSHYVTFVASDTTPYARWYFFDSMADRQGTTNIPEVTELRDFRASLKMTNESVSSVSPQMRRLVKDGYICFYSNPDIPQYLYARPESSVDVYDNWVSDHF